ncbi:MAG: PAS domain S-box protein [Kiritimatiellae bacterium]|nr:PAS domain S-box protein [Kiritimatiellia bacterium]MDW8458291.1 PAS domain S-box protein [Verrucomicrobiota bacterium]
MTWITSHLDLIYFLYGASFALLAALSGAAQEANRPSSVRLPWFWLSFFASVHAVHEWLVMVNFSLDSRALRFLGLFFLGSSYALLFEFGRRGAGKAGFAWRVYAPAASVVTCGIAPTFVALETADGAARFFIGFPASLLSAYAMIRMASEGSPASGTRSLRMAACAFAVYAIAAGATPPPSAFLPARVWNTAAWASLLGFPVELLRAACALTLAAAIWKLSLNPASQGIIASERRFNLSLHATLASVAALSVLTVLSAFMVDRLSASQIRDEMIQKIRAVAALLDQSMLEAVVRESPAETNPLIRSLERELTLAKQAFPDIEQIYLYTLQDGKFVFYASSESNRPETRVRPGEIFEGDVFPEDYEIFENGVPYTIGPFQDRWGRWVSALAPALIDPKADPPVRMVAGLDMPANVFEREIGRWRLVALGIGALVISLLLDLFLRHQRLWWFAQKMAEAERSQRALSEELERRVAERTGQLADANQALMLEMARYRELENKYRSLTERLPAITFRVDLIPRPVTTYVSPRLQDILGYSPAEWLADPDMWKRVLHPEDRDRVLAALKEADQRGTSFSIDFRMAAASGNYRHLRAIMTYEHHVDGKPAVVNGAMIDLTEEVEREARLREAGERYRQLFERSPIGIFHYDLNLRITDANQRFASLVGLTRESLAGADLHSLIGSEELNQALATALRGGESYMEIAGGFVGAPADIWLGIRTLPLVGAKHAVTGGVAIVEDLSDRRRAEEERMRTQKLESLAVMAGGIAHDFNNILTSILGNLSLIRAILPSQTPFEEMLHDAERAALRARDLTRQLLAFTKGGAPQKALHNVPGLIREAADFSLRGSASRCVFEFAADTWNAELDAGQFSQVIQNLVINADQAMPHGGTITVRTSNRMLQAGEVADLPGGAYVQIEVSDTGVGIPERIRNRIFDPYFTTKAQGTGLGLTICYSIVRKHGGHISVSSVEGKGSTFTVLLPAAPDRRPDKSEELDSLPDSVIRGRVLVMDDEKSILAFARRTLEMQGFEVITAENGDEAIRLVDSERRAGRVIDIAILDMTIPGGMGGKETIGPLRDANPDLPVVASSGYTAELHHEEFERYGFSASLSKPYRAQELVQTVHRLLLQRRMKQTISPRGEPANSPLLGSSS